MLPIRKWSKPASSLWRTPAAPSRRSKSGKLKAKRRKRARKTRKKRESSDAVTPKTAARRRKPATRTKSSKTSSPSKWKSSPRPSTRRRRPVNRARESRPSKEFLPMHPKRKKKPKSIKTRPNRSPKMLPELKDPKRQLRPKDPAPKAATPRRLRTTAANPQPVPPNPRPSRKPSDVRLNLLKNPSSKPCLQQPMPLLLKPLQLTLTLQLPSKLNPPFQTSNQLTTPSPRAKRSRIPFPKPKRSKIRRKWTTSLPLKTSPKKKTPKKKTPTSRRWSWARIWWAPVTSLARRRSLHPTANWTRPNRTLPPTKTTRPKSWKSWKSRRSASAPRRSRKRPWNTKPITTMKRSPKMTKRSTRRTTKKKRRTKTMK